MGGELVPSKLQQKPRNLFKTPKSKKPKATPEWRLQAAVVSEFHRWQDRGFEFEFAGDMNAGKRNGARAILCGLKAGETDLRLYLPGATLKMIELKTGTGKLNEDQKKRHAKLRALGFEIETVYAKTPEEAVKKCGTLLNGWLHSRDNWITYEVEK